MDGEETNDLDAFEAPWGRRVALQEVVYESGMRLLRLRIREGRRITQLELDPATARHWGDAMLRWADSAEQAMAHLPGMQPGGGDGGADG